MLPSSCSSFLGGLTPLPLPLGLLFVGQWGKIVSRTARQRHQALQEDVSCLTLFGSRDGARSANSSASWKAWTHVLLSEGVEHGSPSWEWKWIWHRINTTQRVWATNLEKGHKGWPLGMQKLGRLGLAWLPAECVVLDPAKAALTMEQIA